MEALSLDEGVILQDIKRESITPAQLDELKERAGSYEQLFSRRARKFRAQDLHLRSLTEEDYRNLILQEYTFLKRPVLIIDDQIFIGNSKRTVEEAKAVLNDC